MNKTKLTVTDVLLVIVAFIAFCYMTGCANIKFNPETGEIDYSRLGSQKIEGFEMIRGVDGSLSIKFGKQEGSAGALAEALKNISEVAKTATGTP